MKRWCLALSLLLAATQLSAQRNAREASVWLLSTTAPRWGIDFNSGTGVAFWSNPFRSDEKAIGRTVTVADPATGALLFHVGYFANNRQDYLEDDSIRCYMVLYSGRIARNINLHDNAELGTSLVGYIDSVKNMWYGGYTAPVAFPEVCVVPDDSDSGGYHIFVLDTGGILYSRLRLGRGYRARVDEEDFTFPVLRQRLLEEDTLLLSLTATPDCMGRGYWLVACRPANGGSALRFYAFHITGDKVDPQPVVSTIPLPAYTKVPRYVVYTAFGLGPWGTGDWRDTLDVEDSVSHYYWPRRHRAGFIYGPSYGGGMKISPDGRYIVLSQAALPMLYRFDNQSGRVSGGTTIPEYISMEGGMIRAGVNCTFDPSSQYLYTIGIAVDSQSLRQNLWYRDTSDIYNVPDGLARYQRLWIRRYSLPDLRQWQTVWQTRDEHIIVRRGEVYDDLDWFKLYSSQYTYRVVLFDVGVDGNIYFDFSRLMPGVFMRTPDSAQAAFRVRIGVVRNPSSPAPSIDTLTVSTLYARLDILWYTRGLGLWVNDYSSIIATPLERVSLYWDSFWFYYWGWGNWVGDQWGWDIWGWDYFQDGGWFSRAHLKMLFTIPNYISSVSVAGYPESSATCAAPQVQLAPAQLCAGECYYWRPSQVRYQPTYYEWEFDGGEPAAYVGAEPPLICYRQPGTYRAVLIACNANGCDTAVAEVRVLPAPVVSIEGDTALCPGERGVLRARGGVQYRWRQVGDDSVRSSSASVEVVGGQRYVVEVWDGGSCWVRDTVSVRLDAPRAVRLDTVVCRGSVVVLRGGEGRTFVWRDAGGTVVGTDSTLTIVATADADYRVEVQGERWCSDSGWVRLRVGERLEVRAEDVRACAGMPVVLRVLSPAAEAEYVWRDSSGQVIGEGTAVEVQAVESTWYVVEGRTASGCRGSDTVRVEVGQQLAVEAVGDTVVCRGSSVQLAVGRAASDAEYVWYRGGEEIGRGAAVWVVADTAAVYVVHGVRGACEGWDTVVVGVYPPAEVRSQDQRVCRGEDVELTLQGSGVRCWWEDTAGVVLSQSCRYRVTPMQTVRYVGVMEDSNGCRSSVEVQVVVDEPAVVEVWVEPAVVEVGAGQRAFIRVMARSSGVARLRGGVVRVRVPVGVADVEGGQLDGQWKEVALAVGDVTVGGAEQELGRVEIVGVAGGDRSGPVEVRFQGEGCFVVQVRGGEVERQDVCAEALVRVRLVEPVQVVQRNQEVEVRGSGVEEVRLYTLDGREIVRSSGRSLWVGELASGMYLVRIRRGDQWQTVVVLLGR